MLTPEEVKDQDKLEESIETKIDTGTGVQPEEPKTQAQIIRKFLSWPIDNFKFDLWPTSLKVVELDLKNISDQSLEVSVSANKCENLTFKFSAERKGPFEASLQTNLDAEGKRKIFVQVETPQVNIEVVMEAQLTVTLPEFNLSETIPIIIRVVFIYEDLPSEDL